MTNKLELLNNLSDLINSLKQSNKECASYFIKLYEELKMIDEKNIRDLCSNNLLKSGAIVDYCDFDNIHIQLYNKVLLSAKKIIESSH